MFGCEGGLGRLANVDPVRRHGEARAHRHTSATGAAEGSPSYGLLSPPLCYPARPLRNILPLFVPSAGVGETALASLGRLALDGPYAGWSRQCR